MTAIERLKKEVDLKTYIEDVTDSKAHSVGSDTYRFKQCPLCGRGDHFDINTKDNYFNTWGNCGGGSIIDFYMLYFGDDKQTAIQELLKEFNLNDSDVSFNCDEHKNRVKPDDKQTAKPEKVVDLTPYIQDYFTTHGIDYSYFIDRLLSNAEYMDDTDIDNFDRLVVENKLLVANPKDVFPAEHLPKLNNINAYEYIIPVWNDGKVVSCILRRNDKISTEKNKTLNLRGLGVNLFNADYLKHEKLIFVTEGIFDCLSLEMLGYKSICLNSTNNANMFVKLVNNNIDTCKDSTFILAFDNDPAGNNAKDKIYKALKDLEIKVSILSFGKDGQDINDCYLEDIEQLKKDIQDIFKTETVDSYLNKFLENVAANNKIRPAGTGFEQLDDKLNGGLYPGLYTIGAISSLGKTALNLQIADNIAASGQHVLFYSLEMPKDELIARSISRIMFEIDYEKYNGEKCNDVGTNRVLNGHVDTCKDIFLQAVDQYRETTAKHLQIIPGKFKLTADDIVTDVTAFVAKTGIKPVVFIDYLQVVKSSLDRVTEKQATDDTVVKFKVLSGDLNIPVVVVSSFNRCNYTTAVSYESFKESGGIEYTSDFVIGLQLSVLDDMDTDKTKKGELQQTINVAKGAMPRYVTLVILKNRNGKSFNRQTFAFHPCNNLFHEIYMPEGDITKEFTVLK